MILPPQRQAPVVVFHQPVAVRRIVQPQEQPRLGNRKPARRPQLKPGSHEEPAPFLEPLVSNDPLHAIARHDVDDLHLIPRLFDSQSLGASGRQRRVQRVEQSGVVAEGLRESVQEVGLVVAGFELRERDDLRGERLQHVEERGQLLGALG